MKDTLEEMDLPEPRSEYYPCGCVALYCGDRSDEWHRTYVHWVKPGCPFDGKKIGSGGVKGYIYVWWGAPSPVPGLDRPYTPCPKDQ